MTASHDASSLDPTVVSTTSFLHQPTVVTSSVSSLSHHAVASTVVSPTLPSVVRQGFHVPVFKDLLLLLLLENASSLTRILGQCKQSSSC